MSFDRFLWSLETRTLPQFLRRVCGREDEELCAVSPQHLIGSCDPARAGGAVEKPRSHFHQIRSNLNLQLLRDWQGKEHHYPVKMVDKFVGTWKMTTSDNFDEYMKAIGIISFYYLIVHNIFKKMLTLLFC